ncbi:MAG TPA: rhomboid family intramembrane serine protease [Verrucomicrobiae bacterium]|nr:rhomboid family intramembrane serine protease [Verrucomicrobiae bacterium]
MRLIGHLPSENSALTFSDFLCLHGIQNLVESEKDGWAVWIHSEDEIPKAKDFMLAYVGNPQDPKYVKVTRQMRQARDQRERERAEEEGTAEPVERVYVVELGPVTLLLMLASLAFYALTKLEPPPAWLNDFWISNAPMSFREIIDGEVWRLFTPILIHRDFLHVILNVLCLLALGGMIERRHGSVRLALLVLLFAAISNIAQYLVAGPLFGGLSGVIYGLFGYVWLRGRVDPASGFVLPPYLISMMIVWFFICLIPPLMEKAGLRIANGAHAAGLVAGIITGYIAGLRKLAKE